MNLPKTLQEARKIKYNVWAGNPNGQAYVEGRCAGEVWHNYLFFQCSKKSGHGPDGLYCKQHANKYFPTISEKNNV